MENFLHCETFLYQEFFLDCGKLTFLTVEEIIHLIILKITASIETIKTYILEFRTENEFAWFFGGRRNQYYIR